MSVSALIDAVMALEHAQQLSADSRAWLLGGLRAAMFDSAISVDAGLGLRGRWRNQVQAVLRAGLPHLGIEAPSIREEVKHLRSKLLRYAPRGFPADLIASKLPVGERLTWFLILRAHGGKVPSYTALRDLYTGQKSPLFSGHVPGDLGVAANSEPVEPELV